MVEILFWVQSITEGYKDEGWICPDQDYDQVGIIFYFIFELQDSLFSWKVTIRGFIVSPTYPPQYPRNELFEIIPCDEAQVEGDDWEIVSQSVASRVFFGLNLQSCMNGIEFLVFLDVVAFWVWAKSWLSNPTGSGSRLYIAYDPHTSTMRAIKGITSHQPHIHETLSNSIQGSFSHGQAQNSHPNPTANRWYPLAAIRQ